MDRISKRLSSAMSGVRCPGCGQFVVPTEIPVADALAPSDGGSGKRWSFIWRPPSGRICPNCSFPLERYARRAKWIRLFGAGVVLLTGSLLLFVFTMIGGTSSWAAVAQRVLGAIGALALLVGLVGILLGGRRGPASGHPSD
jgi:hypothetical protein